MTPREFDTALSASPVDARLIFETSEGPIGPGYHVTEWKLAHVQSIDCGARRDDWTEASLQLLDGDGGQHMTVGTFRGILAKSMTALPDLADAPFSVEFAPGNAGLRIFQANAPRLDADRVTVTLQDGGATCKPALTAIDATEGCCG